MIQTQTHGRTGKTTPLTQEMITSADMHRGHQLNIEILIGQAALLALDDAFFTAQWEQLSSRCVWGTVFQGKAFVGAWYKLYQDQFLPIIVRTFHNGRLTGLLTVTKEFKSNTILVAGVRAAHYQVWLADQEQGDSFITKAVKALRCEFPSHEINFYNTPPQTPLGWASQEPAWKRHCTIRAFKRPLMDFRDPNIMDVVYSKRFRKRFNQLKKIGDVQFEHVTAVERFSEALEILADQYDFRKAAKYNWVEFRIDPLKKKFLIELFRQGLLHVTLLTLNGKIIASITDTIGNNKWIHGSEIATHCCSHAKHSPGILNFMLLGQLLIHEGYHVYDLTPGNDPYKERLSNAYDYVHEIKITGALQTYINNLVVLPLRAITRNALNKSKLTPKEIKDKARFLRYQLKSIKPKFLISGMFKNLIPSTGDLNSAAVSIPSNKTDLSDKIKSDSLSDLLDYKPGKNEKNKWHFLSDAMHRLENEEIPFTLSRNGQLLFCCWLSKQYAAHAIQNLNLPDGSAVLQGLYYRDIDAQKLKEILANVASHINDSANSTAVFLVTSTKKTSIS